MGVTSRQRLKGLPIISCLSLPCLSGVCITVGPIPPVRASVTVTSRALADPSERCRVSEV